MTTNTGAVTGERAPQKDATELRREYAQTFPGYLQQAITWITGKAMPGQAPSRLITPPWLNAILALLQWPASVLGAFFLFRLNPAAAILCTPMSWVLSVNSLRRLQVEIGHHAVHQEIVRSHRINYIVQAVASAVSLVHNWDDYFDDHIRGHHSRKIFTTTADPDAAFLFALGFRPGRPLPELRAHLRCCIVSPRFHWLFLKARFITNFVTAPMHRKLLAVVSVTFVASSFAFMPSALAVTLVLVPMFPLYHISALLQFTSEHAWMVTQRGPVDWMDVACRTHGRFCLEPLPDPATLRGWSRWATRFLFIALPARFAVLVGDMTVHDLHHCYTAEHHWTDAIWRRQRRIDEGDRWGMRTREYTSLANAVESVLSGISRGEQGGAQLS